MKDLQKSRFLVALLSLLAGLVAAIVYAHAHDDAAWIMADPEIRACCGINDCAVEPEGGVLETAAGYEIKVSGETIAPGDYRVKHKSIDGRFWRCRMTAANKASSTRCLFVPPRSF